MVESFHRATKATILFTNAIAPTKIYYSPNRRIHANARLRNAYQQRILTAYAKPAKQQLHPQAIRLKPETEKQQP